MEKSILSLYSVRYLTCSNYKITICVFITSMCCIFASASTIGIEEMWSEQISCMTSGTSEADSLTFSSHVSKVSCLLSCRSQDCLGVAMKQETDHVQCAQLMDLMQIPLRKKDECAKDSSKDIEVYVKTDDLQVRSGLCHDGRILYTHIQRS